MILANILSEELDLRRRKNRSYSLRSFARDLDVNRTSLCFIINQKRNPSIKTIQKIIAKLNIERNIADQIVFQQNSKMQGDYKTIDLPTFARLSNWYHQGIIALAGLRKNKADPQWLAQRLNIGRDEASEALRTLVELGVVKIDGKKMVASHFGFATPTDVPSQLLRDLQKQILKLIYASLDRDPVHLRDMTTISFPIAAKDLPKIKNDIKKFRRGLCRKFENKQGSDVYTLATHFFPLTHQISSSDF